MDGQSNIGRSQYLATPESTWKKGRNPDPTAAIIDSQSIKGTLESYLESGSDGGKLVKGRKSNILVDTWVVWLLFGCSQVSHGPSGYRVYASQVVLNM